jgi:hypothetical protein
MKKASSIERLRFSYSVALLQILFAALWERCVGRKTSSGYSDVGEPRDITH